MSYDSINPPPRRSPTRLRIKRLTVCAMLCALGVVILYFGALLEIAELCAVALCAMLIVPVVLEYRGGYPWALFFSTAILSLLLLPTKSAALIYLACGSYPILKAYLERLPRLFSRIAKEAVFLFMGFAVFFIWNYIFMMEQMPLWYDLILTLLGVVTLNLFDLALTRLVALYLRRGRGRLHRLMN